MVKNPPISKLNERTDMKNEAIEILKDAVKSKVKIVFADETVFTSKTLPRNAYAVKGQNITIDIKDASHKFISALAGISTDGQLAHLKVTQGAINALSYISFLKKLRKKIPDEKLVLFIDNLSCHKTKKVMDEYKRLRITPCFSSTYDPDSNAAE